MSSKRKEKWLSYVDNESIINDGNHHGFWLPNSVPSTEALLQNWRVPNAYIGSQNKVPTRYLWL